MNKLDEMDTTLDQCIHLCKWLKWCGIVFLIIGIIEVVRQFL